MALETVRIAVDADDYTQIGDGVTALTMTERKVGQMRIYVVAAGGTGPANAAEVSYMNIDTEFVYTGSAADIYVLSPNGATTVGLVRE